MVSSTPARMHTQTWISVLCTFPNITAVTHPPVWMRVQWILPTHTVAPMQTHACCSYAQAQTQASTQAHAHMQARITYTAIANACRTWMSCTPPLWSRCWAAWRNTQATGSLWTTPARMWMNGCVWVWVWVWVLQQGGLDLAHCRQACSFQGVNRRPSVATRSTQLKAVHTHSLRRTVTPMHRWRARCIAHVPLMHTCRVRHARALAACLRRCAMSLTLPWPRAGAIGAAWLCPTTWA